MTAYRFAAIHRAAKVQSLLMTAKARKITAARVAGLDNLAEGQWVRGMLIANTPEVSSASDETWRCVVAALEAEERMDTLTIEFRAELDAVNHMIPNPTEPERRTL